jgi:hypothetical protein
MWFDVFLLVILVFSLTQERSRTKKLELRVKELEWKIESIGHTVVEH